MGGRLTLLCPIPAYAAPRHHGPEKRCGKTTVLDLLALVVRRPLPTANVTTAALFRTIEVAAPTLLIDEADRFVSSSEELIGVLNAGHKRGGQVIRTVGDNHEPRAFNVFAPAAFAVIGMLPGTVSDRSLHLRMRRATAAERPKPIRGGAERAGEELAARCARWCADHGEMLADCDPVMPEGVINRAADNWRPLTAIAQRAGGDWPKRCETLMTADAEADDAGELETLLADIKQVFRERSSVRLPTAILVAQLGDRTDRQWSEMPRTGKPMTATWFTRKLRTVGVERQQWRDPSGQDARVWGFYLDHFNDAFSRYLSVFPEQSGDSGDNVENKRLSGNSKVVTGNPRHHFKSAANPQKTANVTTSPLSTGGLGDEEVFEVVL